MHPRLFLFALLLAAPLLRAEFKAGAAVVDITPPKLPVLVNGGMFSRYVDKINTRIHARAIVFGDGRTQVALVVADSCMMGRPLLDEAKQAAAKVTGQLTKTHEHRRVRREIARVKTLLGSQK